MAYQNKGLFKKKNYRVLYNQIVGLKRDVFPFSLTQNVNILGLNFTRISVDFWNFAKIGGWDFIRRWDFTHISTVTIQFFKVKVCLPFTFIFIYEI